MCWRSRPPWTGSRDLKFGGITVAKFAVILPAAGKSSRFGHSHYKKPFAPLDGRPVWLHAAEKFVNRNDVEQVILVIAPEDRELFAEKFAGNAALLGVQVIDGGDERFQSVENGVKAANANCDFTAIHDAARPCIANEWIDRVFADAAKHGAAILARRRPPQDAIPHDRTQGPRVVHRVAGARCVRRLSDRRGRLAALRATVRRTR